MCHDELVQMVDQLREEIRQAQADFAIKLENAKRQAFAEGEAAGAMKALASWKPAG